MDVRQKLVQLAEGVYVEEDALRIAEKIQEYDSNLRLKYCERPSSLTDAPYKLVEICPDGAERIVFDIWELDDRVLHRLYAADTARHDINDILDTTNQKARDAAKRRYKDIQDEAAEIAKSVFKSEKETYKLKDPFTGKNLKVHQHAPVEVEDER